MPHGSWQRDAQVANLVPVDFEHGDIDDHFRAGTIEVVDELLREQELVGGGADDDGVLRWVRGKA